CRSLTRFEGRSAFTTWLHRIVVNTALDRLRRHQARRERSSEDDDRDGGVPETIDEQTPERVLCRSETRAAVRGALERLSQSHREVLVRRELDGESYRDVA